jgi:tetratricopeptide (TPR) repeat protein
VVYDSILTGRKKKLHEEIGNAVEELYKDSLREHYEVLAEHYIFAENYPKGAEYSRLAGRKAEKAALLNDAIVHARKRVTSLERLPRTEDVEREIIDARVALGLYFLQLTCFAEAKESIDPIIDLTIRHEYKKRICQIYTIIGTHDWFVEENYEKATEALTKAINISEGIGNIVAYVFANYWLGCTFSYNCEYEKAENCFQKALDINVAANNLWGIAAINSNLAIYYYYYSGKIDQGYKITEEALRSAEESGDIYSKALACTSHGNLYLGKGLLGEAERHTLIGLEMCERIQMGVWNSATQFNLGEIYFELGNFTKSRDHYEKAISVLGNSQSVPSWIGLARVGVARSKVMNKEKDVNLELLSAHYRNNRIKVVDGWIQRYIGEIFLNIDDRHFSEAEHWIHGAIEADERNGMMLHLGRDHALCAELFKRKGDRSKFQEHLGKAIDLFKECGADGWLKKAEEEFATLS